MKITFIKKFFTLLTFSKSSIKIKIKPFEAPQRSVKIKILREFFLFVRDRGGKG